MATCKIKTGDTVRVITGKDKGKEGKVLSVDAKHDRVLVEGANIITKHQRPSASNQTGGIVNREAPIHISNVMVVSKGKPSRVGFTLENGKKKRIAKASGEVLD